MRALYADTMLPLSLPYHAAAAYDDYFDYAIMPLFAMLSRYYSCHIADDAMFSPLLPRCLILLFTATHSAATPFTAAAVALICRKMMRKLARAI